MAAGVAGPQARERLGAARVRAVGQRLERRVHVAAVAVGGAGAEDGHVVEVLGPEAVAPAGAAQQERLLHRERRGGEEEREPALRDDHRVGCLETLPR